MEPMAQFDPAFAVLRALHAGGSIVLFGELVFARVVLGPGGGRHDHGRGPALAIASIVAVVSWIAWLALEAAAMGGVAWRDAIALVPRVLAETEFGRTWLVRAALLLALGAWLLRSRGTRHASMPGTVLAGLVLATLAWAGHANAQTGLDGALHHLADASHALAAGAWIGSLRPLAASLHGGSSFGDDDARTVARYGRLGLGCVAVLVASGVVNAAYTLGAPAHLLDSGYGRLLLAKLLLFATLLAVAAVNRWRLTPVIVDHRAAKHAISTARLRMQRLAWLEAGLGVAIVAIAGALGSAAPPMSH
jgi:putative copper resistance protein D